jgi:DNA invertase Pin-like site-specific DNA recombinase
MTTKPVRCAIYTRVSTDHGFEQDFNSLDAQHDAAQAYIRSQAHAGWTLIRARYDDGGYSGGSTDRPALQRLLSDVKAGKIDVIIVYKVDRLTRSLADFAKLVELFDEHGVSFVSITQQFNTTTSMGRLTLNVLLSFAQFEREVTSERIRDKIAASKRKGLWVGGIAPLGYATNEGCRRRTTASRHRRYSPARCSHRVVPPIRDARFVDLILAVFMCNSGRRQERVCRAQRPAPKIDAIATYRKFRAAQAPVSHGERPAGNLACALARLEPRPAPVQRRNSTGHRSELARPTPALVRDQAVLPAATV